MTWIAGHHVCELMTPELAEHILAMPEHQLWDIDWWYAAMACLMRERASA